jgi:Bax protein
MHSLLSHSRSMFRFAILGCFFSLLLCCSSAKDEVEPAPFGQAELSQSQQPIHHQLDSLEATGLSKKTAFFTLMRPMIQLQNGLLHARRTRLLMAQTSGEDLSFVQKMAAHYRCTSPTLGTQPLSPTWQEMLSRVDEVPLELAMAQAANESAWGRSRFAREANNLFGQWCFVPGCGLVPRNRPEGSVYEVRSFDSIQGSVSAYMHNLNTGSSYQALRALRSDKRSRQEYVTGHDLAPGLMRYSSRGQAYVDEIKKMMRVNQEWMVVLDK